MVLKKFEIEKALHVEHQEISAGRLKEDNPLDQSEDFRILCEACRRGDLRVCQEKIQEGANINARDRFDYTPLILASLCGHFEVVQLLLESGALCERDTFQGERAVYNALNDRIRNLLLSYDYSKSRDPLQPLAAHVTSLLNREVPQTSDITLETEEESLPFHKFILAARSPYFAKKLTASPGTTVWRVPATIPNHSLKIALRALYFREVNVEFQDTEEDQAILTGIQRLAKHLEIENLLDLLFETDRRLQRQKRSEEAERGRTQLDDWFERNVVQHKMRVAECRVDEVKWDRQNSIFADVLLCASEDDLQDIESNQDTAHEPANRGASDTASSDIPVGPSSVAEAHNNQEGEPKYATLYPAHRAMLLRSEYFSAMFSSPFREAQPSIHLPIVRVDCQPEVLEIILKYLYTEHANFGLDIAIEVLFAADQLFIEKLKVKAAVTISTLGNGTASVVEANNARGETEPEDAIDVYDVIRAGWHTRVHRLEEFGARFIAYRLERFIDEAEFRELVQESANRIQGRQETDTVELIDDIRYYLSERFRLRFEDSGLDDILETNDGIPPTHQLGADGIEEKYLADRLNGVPVDEQAASPNLAVETGVIRTLNGDVAGDEFAQDALNYQILLGKIDTLLESLKLDA